MFCSLVLPGMRQCQMCDEGEFAEGEMFTVVQQIGVPSCFSDGCEASGSHFDERYEIQDHVLGTGAAGDVKRGVCKLTGAHVAVKCYKKAKMKPKDLQHMRGEIDIHPELLHPNIVRLDAVFETREQVLMVLEELQGGEVFDRVISLGQLSEEEAGYICEQVLCALEYLHTMGVVHCDLKLENIMFQTKGSKHIKLIDLGYASRLENHRRAPASGTLQYVAPEVLAGQSWSEKRDMWSLGCVVYIMLTGKQLFSGEEKVVISKNRSCRVDWSRRFRALPNDAQAFVRLLLSADPSARPTVQHARQHPWLQRLGKARAKALVAATIPVPFPPNSHSPVSSRANEACIAGGHVVGKLARVSAPKLPAMIQGEVLQFASKLPPHKACEAPTPSLRIQAEAAAVARRAEAVEDDLFGFGIARRPKPSSYLGASLEGCTSPL